MNVAPEDLIEKLTCRWEGSDSTAAVELRVPRENQSSQVVVLEKNNDQSIYPIVCLIE